jgi:hypothetical protein
MIASYPTHVPDRYRLGNATASEQLSPRVGFGLMGTYAVNAVLTGGVLVRRDG